MFSADLGNAKAFRPQLTFVSKLRHDNYPPEEDIPQNWSECCIVCSLCRVKLVVDVTHWGWSKERKHQRGSAEIPADFKLTA